MLWSKIPFTGLIHLDILKNFDQLDWKAIKLKAIKLQKQIDFLLNIYRKK